jgi:hypothetical protein
MGSVGLGPHRLTSSEPDSARLASPTLHPVPVALYGRHMKPLQLFLTSLLWCACVDGARDGSTEDSADAADTRSEVDTGGLTCGKCVQLWHTDYVDFGGYQHLCRIDDATGSRCCPTRGDTGCPEDHWGYEWQACEQVSEAFGVAYCIDEDARVQGRELQQRGALCAEEALGCDPLPRQN